MTNIKTPAVLLLGTLLSITAAPSRAQPCGNSGIALQTLGTNEGGLGPKRAGSSSLLWIDGRARILIDAGSGSALRLAQSDARISDLDAIIFTTLLTDYSADLPAIVLAARRAGRTRTLPVFGPPGGRGMPSTVGFVRDLFDSTRGAWRHLGEHLAPLAKGVYKLDPHDVRDAPARLGAAREPRRTLLPVPLGEGIKATALSALHAGTPELSWRIEADGKAVVFASLTGETDPLLPLIQDARLLVVYGPVNSEVGKIAETFGRVAQTARVGQMILAHRRDGAAHEEALLVALRKNFSGPVTLAEDLACFTP
ncbi:MAG: hypothetical protein OEV31_09255 [Gammaproteobacteria bacterium]|nr:hypothetical protein [Gammaproteobacteria bacterium]